MRVAIHASRTGTAHRHSWQRRTRGLQHALIEAIGPVQRQPSRLRYVSDCEPGIRRIRNGSGFRYVDARGVPVRDAEMLLRIRNLAIPPAYEDVWICATDDGHLQATARDARGRKQYRYHPDWREKRDADKFGRMAAFGRALPRIRRRVQRDLQRDGVSRERVLATVVRLLERTLVRVGNEEYARANGSYGLTTLRDEHVRVRPQAVRFLFKGKAGIAHDVEIADPRLAAIVRRCRDIPGQQLFRYVDESGASRSIASGDVNDYIREIAGAEFSAKDFRTWAGSVLAMAALSRRGFGCLTQAKREVVAAIKEVALRLGNTPAVCRKAYIHPQVLEQYMAAGPAAFPAMADVTAVAGLQLDEARLLRFLERFAAHPATARSASSQSRAKRAMPKRAAA